MKTIIEIWGLNKKIIIVSLILAAFSFIPMANAVNIGTVEITNRGIFYPDSILCYKTTIIGTCENCYMVMRIEKMNKEVIAEKTYNFVGTVKGCISIPSNAQNRKHVLRAVIKNTNGNDIRKRKAEFNVNNPTETAAPIEITKLEINNEKAEYLPGDMICSKITFTGACERSKLRIVLKRNDGLDETLPKLDIGLSNAGGERTLNGLCLRIPNGAWGGDYHVKGVIFTEGNRIQKVNTFKVKLDDTVRIRRVQITDMGDGTAGTRIRYNVIITGVCRDCNADIKFKRPDCTRDDIWAAFEGKVDINKDTGDPIILNGYTYSPFLHTGGYYRLMVRVKKNGQIITRRFTELNLAPVTVEQMLGRYDDARFEWMLDQAFPSGEGWIKTRIV